MRTRLGALAFLLTACAAGAPSARGLDFTLEVGPPIAGNSSLSKNKKAVVAVRSVSCHPNTVTISGTAHGIVNGTRRSIPLKLIPLDTPGVYTVPRVWEQGRWVLELSGMCAERHKEAAATIVPLGPGGFIRDAVKVLARAATAAEIDAALRDARPDTE